MAMPTYLLGADGRKVKVNELGEVQVANGGFDLTKSNTLSTTGAFNYYKPVIGQQFIVTGVLAFAQKTVSATDGALVTIYEGSTAISTDVEREILFFGIGALKNVPYPNIRLAVSEGAWVNAKVDDPTVILNIVGYFAPTFIKDVGTAIGVA